VSVYPNPYFGTHAYERKALERFITFNHLPEQATIKIFTLSGELVRTLTNGDPTFRTDPTSTLGKWNLRNREQVYVAAGMYIAYVDAPGLGTKVLKLAILQREERIDTF
ncbi:MAG: T9SS type A sorting domain-containing protein, partial [Rhizobacter sp.]|nr:T9SS type A sorting domain-containing protein [Chlorobiales bacterium]